MPILNSISEAEFSAMDSYRRYYAYSDYTDTHKEKGLRHVLRYWESNKSRYLFKLLGEKLIYSKEIKYERPSEEVYDQFYYELTSDFDSPLKIFREYFIKQLNKIYTTDDYKNQEYWLCSHLLEPSVLTDNKVGLAYDLEINDKKIRVQQESKPVKVLRKIVTALELDEELFEKFRLKHSLILNQKMIKGELCLSIHPYDYMTMSDNNNDWESCMSWINEGCYRRGTVEMMNSPSVIVAYLKSSRNTTFYGTNLEWSNKKWRQLFVVTEDFATGIKGYPYHNLELEKEVLKTIAELAKENLGWEYYDQFPKFIEEAYRCHNYPVAKINLTDDENFWVKLNFSVDTMYNDFHSGCENYVIINTNITENTDIDYFYGGPVVCMCCGCENSDYGYDDEAMYLVCDHCGNSEPDPYAICSECGDDLYDRDDCVELDSGYTICNSCYDEGFYFVDPINDLQYPNSEGYTVFLKDKQGNVTNKSIITSVLTRYNYTAEWDQYFKTSRICWDGLYSISENDCTEAGLKLFKE